MRYLIVHVEEDETAEEMAAFLGSYPTVVTVVEVPAGLGVEITGEHA